MRFLDSDVKKPLAAVSAMNDEGSTVVFSRKCENHIENDGAGKRIPLERVGETLEMVLKRQKLDEGTRNDVRWAENGGKKIAGMEARVCAVLGGQWGDEGKGKLADVLAKNYDVVGRFNGGNNAGHTVVVDGKKYAFHLLPCGLIYPHTQNILGNGTVVHIDSLFKELEPLDADGLEWRGRLKISNRAHILFDFHQEIDGMNEDRLAPDKKIGTTTEFVKKVTARSLDFM